MIYLFGYVLVSFVVLMLLAILTIKATQNPDHPVSVKLFGVGSFLDTKVFTPKIKQLLLVCAVLFIFYLFYAFQPEQSYLDELLDPGNMEP